MLTRRRQIRTTANNCPQIRTLIPTAPKFARKDADFNELVTKTEGLEKRNATLVYELRVLEKEISIRNEENEFNRRTEESTRRQHLENVKKIAKLEAECQRLRVLVRKRLPGPSALSKMRSEVQVLERGVTEDRAQNGSRLMIEKCYQLEEENNALKETLQKKLNELQASRNMCARVSARLTQAESVNASMSEVGSDDKVSCAGSCANSYRSNGVSSNMNLMDDFAEMEKLAFASVDNKPIQTNANMIGNEMVPVSSCEPSLSISISRVIQIIEGIKLEPQECASDKNLEAPGGYIVRVFQWKATEAADVVQRFLEICCDLLHGKVDFVRFSHEVEAKCLELQVELDSLETKDVQAATNGDQDKKQLQTEWEIDEASEKLAKCQETIFNLGKQLKALAPPQDNARSPSGNIPEKKMGILRSWGRRRKEEVGEEERRIRERE